MKRRTLIPIALLTLQSTAVAQHYATPVAQSLRQEESARLTDDGHHYGSLQNLDTRDRYYTADGSDTHDGSNALERRDMAAIRLINDYHLAVAGTAARIEKWTSTYPVHPLTERLRLLRANLLVREGNYKEALAIYAATNAGNVPADEQVDAQLHEAIAYIHRGELQRARRLLDVIDARQSLRQMDVQYYAGYVRYAEGNYTEALPYLQTAAASHEYRNLAPVYVADCQLQTGDARQALTTIQQYLRTHPSTALTNEARRIEGEALHDTGDYHTAITALERYVGNTDAPQRTALYKLGNSYFQTKNYGRSADAFSRSAGTANDALAQNAWLHAGIGYVHSGNKQQARMAFQQASQMNFDADVQEEALYNYALTLHDGATMGFGESVTVFEQFLNQFPKSRYRDSVSHHLTEVYFTTKNYPAALASINKIKNPNANILAAKQKVLYNLGAQHFTDGNFRNARDYMQLSIESGRQATAAGSGKLMEKETADAYYWKGESEYRLGEYAAAVKDLRQYMTMAPANTRNGALAHYTLGYSLFKQKQYAAALPAFRSFIEKANRAADTNNDRKLASLRGDTYNRIGDCLFSARQYDEAYAAYQSALEADRVNGDYALLQQALISGLRGDYDKKVALLGQLAGEYRDSEYGADALFEQGRAYVQSGNSEKAMSTYQLLLERYPQSALSRRAENEIGMIQAENGQTDAAVQTYRNVIQKYPNSAEAQTALVNLKDIYTAQGRISEYADIARQAGKALSADELDDMVQSAAVRATANGNHEQALTYYQQLEAQTPSAATRMDAQIGQLHAADAAHRADAVIAAADRLLQDGAKTSPDVAAEARLLRAHAYMTQNNTDAAVADLQALSEDTRTVYGAQGTVELAQYAYDTRQYASAETLLTTFINSGTTHSYWLARAFVLLADVYSQTDRTIEARQYLLSLKSNYTESEEINNMIDKRLQQLK